MRGISPAASRHSLSLLVRSKRSPLTELYTPHLGLGSVGRGAFGDTMALVAGHSQQGNIDVGGRVELGELLR